MGEENKKISKEEVIAKLKDDGDFDKLRLKIVRKLKDNEELRNSITAAVKQSTALNRPGAENMKLRHYQMPYMMKLGECNHRQQHHKAKQQLPRPYDGDVENCKKQPSHSQVGQAGGVDVGVPPGFSEDIDRKQPCDVSDEDPDVPPGFG
ncbi:YTH family protein, putative isoform 1 [Hibiscus syriacus]|uniref:YTH family protein, putative isoform 1 n=1 Tax=Hibiscus syriacus TaxID=106335 RepID=A0A6A3BCN5_HIBSY|nr:YTH family protein, putative isoform 1 [Hibiscus syriacus]